MKQIDRIRNMKKASILILIILIPFILLGCSKSYTSILPQNKQNERFVCIEEYQGNISLYVDAETGVEYLRTYGCIIVIVNEDGTPKIHDTDKMYID